MRRYNDTRVAIEGAPGGTVQAHRRTRKDRIGGGKMTVFAERIQAHIDEGKSICEGLSHEGPAIIRRLQDRGSGKLSLRTLAVAAKLSPTYLSKILAGTQVISKGAYMRLSVIETQWIEHDAKQKGGSEAK